MKKIIIGIYRILDLKNNFSYVGESINIKNRWKQHKYYLRNNKYIKTNPYLQNSWNKHKEESFEFLILEECKIEELKIKEEYYINFYESWNPEKGYNIERYSNGVKIFSKETKQKMSDRHKGKILSKEHRQKISESLKGISKEDFSEEHKMKIGNSNRGKTRKFSRDHNEKISKSLTKLYSNKENHPMYGKHISEEHKKKISIANSGQNHPRSKLTWEQVKEIRQKYIPRKYTMKMLSLEYNVNISCIQAIIEGRIWKKEENK